MNFSFFVLTSLHVYIEWKERNRGRNWEWRIGLVAGRVNHHYGSASVASRGLSCELRMTRWQMQRGKIHIWRISRVAAVNRFIAEPFKKIKNAIIWFESSKQIKKLNASEIRDQEKERKGNVFDTDDRLTSGCNALASGLNYFAHRGQCSDHGDRLCDQCAQILYTIAGQCLRVGQF